MKRSADYETDNGVVSIRPNMVQQYETDEGRRPKSIPIGKPEFAYITIFTTTSKIHINKEYIHEVIEMLQAIESRYITKTE